ncbi:hypothetical protein BDQ12DRAFT_663430 [Crucibulum laeve]|uniref:Uncharacterized protein n=1 Tax=Crucibulum laeve TaxID=68775 RepID=A0A5C3M9Q7_9AGAR|nr:hypothetical protein BDQ12DRAFT_663430 [Crucibulum laeve]
MRFTTIAFALGAVSATVVAALPVDFDSDIYARDWEDSDDLYSREEDSKDLVTRATSRPSPSTAKPLSCSYSTSTPSSPADHYFCSSNPSPCSQLVRFRPGSAGFIPNPAHTKVIISSSPAMPEEKRIDTIQVPPHTTTTAQASRVTPKARKAHRARGWDDSGNLYGSGRGSKGRKVIKKFGLYSIFPLVDDNTPTSTVLIRLWVNTSTSLTQTRKLTFLLHHDSPIVVSTCQKMLPTIILNVGIAITPQAIFSMRAVNPARAAFYNAQPARILIYIPWT